MKTQHGASLIELMIASTIGLFLILGLGTIFYSMRQTSIARQGLSTLQNNERLAMTFLTTSIRGAGYYTFSTAPGVIVSPGIQFPAVPGSFTQGQSIFGTSSGGTTDTLSVRFVTPQQGAPGSVIQGCSAGLAANTPYTDTYSIQPSLPGVPVTNDLVCTENGVINHLIAGVQGMTVLYGIDTSPNRSGSVTEYVTASGVTNWVNVKTVSVTLLFANPLIGPANQPQTVSFSMTAPYMNGL